MLNYSVAEIRLDIFLLKRIEENREELRHNLDSTLQVEQACLEEIVKGIKHCKTNITLRCLTI